MASGFFAKLITFSLVLWILNFDFIASNLRHLEVFKRKNERTSETDRETEKRDSEKEKK